MARSDTRQRMIETASALFQREGYRATSWRKLVDEAGTPWGSAHHHFPGGKEQLGVAAVKLGADAVAWLIAHCFEQEGTPAEAVRAWFDASATLIEQSDYREGCPITTVALETVPDSETMTAACSSAFERWRGLVADGLGNAGVEPARASELATTVLAGFEGALVLARVSRSTEPLRITAQQLAAVLSADGRQLAGT